MNEFTRKWLGVSPGLTDIAMCCRKAKLKSIVEEYKCGKARRFRGSSSDIYSGLPLQLKTRALVFISEGENKSILMWKCHQHGYSEEELTGWV
ncbi:reverse transcriptase [Plakobranchus ocellatus]|uniref:Reverse transcriptase n=1 Tax=Plakobranchus ocellatus TaxID=259542 RepID=A0AAV4DEN2_9GAST|nr:reverse transcriptase [Plakobranchus ocellatus]